MSESLGIKFGFNIDKVEDINNIFNNTSICSRDTGIMIPKNIVFKTSTKQTINFKFINQLDDQVYLFRSKTEIL